MRWLVSVTDRMDRSLNRFREIMKDRGAWRASVHGVAKSQIELATEQQQQINELNERNQKN